MRKRILSLLLCIVLCLSFAPTAVFAEDLPEMTGVTISQNGIMSWDAVAGAAKYHVGIGGQGWDVTETSVDLISLFNRTGYDTGSYSVNVTAYNASGERITKQWMLNNYSFTATNPKLATPTNLRWDGATAKWDPVPKINNYLVLLYKNGSRVRAEYYYSEEAQFPLEAGNDYTFSVRASAPGYTDSDWADSEVNHFTGNTAIKNVRISEDGFITWDPFPGASSYGVSIVEAATGHRVETTFDDLNRLCSGLAAGNYTIRLNAYDSNLQIMTETWTGSFSYLPGREFSVTVTNGGAYTDSALNNRITVATMGDKVYLVPDVPEGKIFNGWEVISPANLVISTRYPMSFTMPACNVEVTAKLTNDVSRITAIDVTCPGYTLNGNIANAVPTTTTEGVTISDYEWLDNDGNVLTSGTFAADTQYRLAVYLNASEGYDASGVVKANIKVNNAEATYFTNPCSGGDAARGDMKIYHYPAMLESGVEITSVEVTPNTITIPMDSQQQFTATVIGIGSFSDEVTWSITGGNNGTNISADGLLSVARYNTASDTIIVKATSVADPSKYGTATVTLTPAVLYISSVEVTCSGYTLGGNIASAVPTTTTEGVTISAYEWQDNDGNILTTGTFAADTQYRLAVYLEVADGYDASGVVKANVKVNNAEATYFTNPCIGYDADFGDMKIYHYPAMIQNTAPTTYTVTYDANGGTGTMNPEICTIDAEKGYADYVFPACGFTAPEGKEFDCWTVEGITGSISPQTRHALFGDMIVKAVWKDSTAPQPTTYTVSFEMNGHGDQITAQMVNEGAKATKPADPTEIGYMFVGWCKDSSFATAWNFDTDTVTADTTLYALWAQNTTVYTIIAGANGEWTKGSTTGLAFTSDAPFDKFDSVKIDGTVIAAANYTAEVGSTKITLAPAYLETLSVGTHTIEIVSNDGSASTNFTVKSAEQPPVVPTNYTVTFNMNGHGDQITAQTVKEGEKATKPTDPTVSGWTFNGWYADATFSAAFDFDTAINADTTIYAKWTKGTSDPGTTDPQPATYTVTFNMNGHGTQVAAQTVEDGNKATKPTDPSASGYTFDGWYADATFSAKFNFDSAITANTTVYAKWTEVKKDEPSNPANPTKPADPTSPQTGDNSHLFLWIALLLISGSALAGTAVYGKKRKYNAK